MRTTASTFYKLALFTPYLALVVLYPFFSLGVGPNSPSGILLPYLSIIAIIYFFGVPYWLLPYTILVIILWRASRTKTKSQIYKMFIWSPIYFSLFLTAFYIIVSSVDLFPNVFYLGGDILSTSLFCMLPAPIVFGYLFIGFTAWIYSFLSRKGMIVEEETTLNLEGLQD